METQGDGHFDNTSIGTFNFLASLINGNIFTVPMVHAKHAPF